MAGYVIDLFEPRAERLLGRDGRHTESNRANTLERKDGFSQDDL
jgi:hypothetical protein